MLLVFSRELKQAESQTSLLDLRLCPATVAYFNEINKKHENIVYHARIEFAPFRSGISC